MPQYSGGDIVGITFNHPTLGTFNFATKSNESYTIDPGGYRSNDDANAITGSGQMIDQINRVRPSIEGPIIADFVSDNEMKNLPLLAESSELSTVTIEMITGVVWKMKGKFVGDINFDTNTSQVASKIAGEKRMEKIS